MPTLVSNSQLGQDLWVLNKLNKKDGFFVEAGACDGVYFSNTFLLEKIGWKGICCEPNKKYYEKLKNNRRCFVDDHVLYDNDGKEIDFYGAGDIGGTKEDFLKEKCRLNRRLSIKPYKAITVTFNKLLEKYGAPRIIDYVSLDTEGSELRILKEIDFKRWKVRIFSVEHNVNIHNDIGYLELIKSFLSDLGYRFELNKWDSYFWI